MEGGRHSFPDLEAKLGEENEIVTLLFGCQRAESHIVSLACIPFEDSLLDLNQPLRMCFQNWFGALRIWFRAGNIK